MASSPDPERRRVGSALLRLAHKGQARRKSIAKRRASVAKGDFRIAYLGVRTKYDKTGSRIYEPVITKAIYL